MILIFGLIVDHTTLLKILTKFGGLFKKTPNADAVTDPKKTNKKTPNAGGRWQTSGCPALAQGVFFYVQKCLGNDQNIKRELEEQKIACSAQEKI